MARPALDRNSREQFVRATGAQDWKAMFALITANDFAAPADHQLLTAGVGSFVLARLDHYQPRWNETVGAFAVALGLGDAGVEPTAEAVLAPARWGAQKWEVSHRVLAFDNATGNLMAAAERGSKLTLSWAGELCGIGHREGYLRCLSVLAGTPGFFPRLAHAPALIPADAAARLRAQRVIALAGASGLTPLGRRVDHTVLYKCLRVYGSLSKGGRTVDAPELLLALLGKGTAGRPWLAAQVAAVTGRVCGDCGEVLEELGPSALRRVTERRAGRGAEKSADFVLSCRGCARLHRPRPAVSGVAVAPVAHAGDFAVLTELATTGAA
jgi:hypothetical protein